jgi:hypothetical protein
MGIINNYYSECVMKDINKKLFLDLKSFIEWDFVGFSRIAILRNAFYADI